MKKNLGYLVFFLHSKRKKEKDWNYIDILPANSFLRKRFSQSRMKEQFYNFYQAASDVALEGYKKWWEVEYENLSPEIIKEEGFTKELSEEHLEKRKSFFSSYYYVQYDILGYFPTLIEADIARVKFIKDIDTLGSRGLNIIDDIYGEEDYVSGAGYTLYGHISPKGKYYIGITKQKLEKRWNNGKNYKDQKKFWNAIRYYGWENFEHVVFKTGLNKRLALYWEEKYITKYNAVENGYNVLYSMDDCIEYANGGSL